MTCLKGMTKETCPYNPRLGCDCGLNLPNSKLKMEAREWAKYHNTVLRTYDAHEKANGSS